MAQARRPKLRLQWPIPHCGYATTADWNAQHKKPSLGARFAPRHRFPDFPACTKQFTKFKLFRIFSVGLILFFGSIMEEYRIHESPSASMPAGRGRKHSCMQVYFPL